jgi:hypothetical protein
MERIIQRVEIESNCDGRNEDKSDIPEFKIFSHVFRSGMEWGDSKSATCFFNNATSCARTLFFSAKREIITLNANTIKTRKRIPKKNKAFEGTENLKKSDIPFRISDLTAKSKKRHPVTIQINAYRSRRYFLLINSTMTKRRMTDPITANRFTFIPS